MNFDEGFRKVKKGWRWIWDSNSIWSWIVALVVIFIGVKYVFFPVLGFVMGTSLPLAGVESSSMDHQIIYDDFGNLQLCGNVYSADEDRFVDFNSYWDECGEWYSSRGISKDEFFSFSLNNGFRKGDIIIVWGRFTPKIGDVIIFKPNPESLAPRPIIHRIVGINDGFFETKGDHNSAQLVGNNNLYKTDETRISENQIIGKAIVRVPYLGWVKIWFVELLGKLF